ncbi:hypothetical protein LJR230_005233 [Trinickia sp. LjRoot230]
MQCFGLLNFGVDPDCALFFAILCANLAHIELPFEQLFDRRVGGKQRTTVPGTFYDGRVGFGRVNILAVAANHKNSIGPLGWEAV